MADFRREEAREFDSVGALENNGASQENLVDGSQLGLRKSGS